MGDSGFGMMGGMLDMLDDNALMLRYRDDGDVAAFEVLYTRHKGGVYRYLLRQCGDEETARDLFQETWSRVIKARDRYRPLAKFTTYVYRLAHNCLVDRHRRDSIRPGHREWSPLDEEQAASEGRGPEAESAARETAARLRVALDRLPDAQREAFLLHQESGLTLKEIARITGVGRETIKSRLRYAVAHLRRLLQAEPEPMTGTEL